RSHRPARSRTGSVRIPRPDAESVRAARSRAGPVRAARVSGGGIRSRGPVSHSSHSSARHFSFSIPHPSPVRDAPGAELTGTEGPTVGRRLPRRVRPARSAAPRGPGAGGRGSGGSGEYRRRRLEVLQLDAGSGEDDVTAQVHGVLLAGGRGGDLVFPRGQGAVVGGVCFCLPQGPGLVEGAGGEDRVREGDETDAGGRRGGGEAQE